MAVINGPSEGGAWLPGTAGDDTINAYGNNNSLYGDTGTNYLIAHGGNNNNLVAGPGIDYLDGGSGQGNIASYQLSSGPVTASLANSAINTGDAAGDTYTNLHALTGSPYGGSYYADNSGLPNQLWALSGTNYLYGGTGFTTFIGGTGPDHMVAGSGGGYVDYEWSSSGVIASLADSAINTGDAAGDTYSNLRSLGGTAYNDVLWLLDGGGNVLGQDGNDVLHGGNGSDTLNGGPGSNTLYGGASADWFVFGGASIGPGDSQLDPLTILTDARNGIFTTVADFDQSSGQFDSNEYDSIDLAPLLSTQFNSGYSINSLVRFVEDSSNTFATVQVDVTGSGANWLTVAHLNGVPGNASIHVIFDEAQSAGVSMTVQAAPPPIPVDFNNDLIWFNSGTRQTDLWDISNGNWSASFSVGTHPDADASIAGVGHFYGSGASDILWYNANTGNVSQWQIAGGQWAATVEFGSHPGGNWRVAGTGDFNGDGTDDIFWFNSNNGDTDQWQLANGNWAASVSAGNHPGAGWQVAAIGDFNGDNTSDILWNNSQTGTVDLWTLSDGKWAGSTDMGAHPGSGWTVGGSGDFNGDGTSDVLWFNASSGQTDIWMMSNSNWAASVSPGNHPGSNWQVAVVADLTQDGQSDIVFSNTQTGALDEWKIVNGQWAGSVDLGPHPGTNWHVAGVGDFAHF